MKLFSQSSFSFEPPSQLELAGDSYKIKVLYSKKKNSSVQAEKNSLVFRLSSYLSQRQRETHFNELLEKIQKKLLKRPQLLKEYTLKDALEQGFFFFSGERFDFEYSRKRGVVLKGQTFVLAEEYDLEKVEKRIVQLLCKRYEGRLSSYVQVLNEKTFCFSLGEFSLKLSKSKWGHCSSKNDIMLNLKLLNAPLEILDYVIIHELAHVRHKNHSRSFWTLVERFCPSHKRMRKYLREQSPQLYQLKHEC